jgi:predicted RND superfamily exporter protein
VLAIIYAAPLAAVFRGLILNAPILPIFAIVFGATSAFGMVIWRGIYLFWIKRSP